ncbi:phage baseplate assembly protein V [Notoacmeibacter ruber]|uniref:Phage baseplate protein n=1 Tax=Notoacmeibacter ruber TaxID=2670375 RepID=A0A3L7JEN0_9HYPH|nr:phage baseplate assembly protein V [Notoacmeibacter ruber]RLQ88914.1 phage baseplate protein [Notoacmeibacter ruber]
MMDGTSPIGSAFRRQARQIERLNRRIAQADIPGKVLASSQDYETRTLRLDLGRSADGRVIKSPPVAWPQQGAGKARLHTPPKDGEQMRLRSPSGAVGTGSLADWGTYDQDTAPPSDNGDEAVIAFGDDTLIRLTADAIELNVGGKGFRLTREELAMSTVFRAKGGSRPAHFQGGVDSAGDAALSGNDNVLI